MRQGESADAGESVYSASFVYERQDRIYVDSRPRPEFDNLMGLHTLRLSLILRGQWSLGARLLGELQLPGTYLYNDATSNPQFVRLLGLGDAMALFHFRLARAAVADESDDHEAPARRVHGLASVGLRLPTGSIEGQDSTGRRATEETLQLGTGRPAGVAGGSVFFALGKKTSLFGSVLGRLSLGETKYRYHYGAGMQATAGGEILAGDSWSFSLTAACLYAAPDRFEDDVAESTGRTDVQIGPGVAWSASRNLTVRFSALAQVVTRVHGLQLVTPVAATLSLAWRR